jgi:hypothetical protein
MFDRQTRTFDPTTQAQLQAHLLNEDYVAGYTLLSNILLELDPLDGTRAIEDPTVHQVQLFLEGAALINDNVGIFASGIRNYHQGQNVFRHSDTFSTSELQDASDLIAQTVLQPIADNGLLPTIDVIANQDAEAVRDQAVPRTKRFESRLVRCFVLSCARLEPVIPARRR